MPNYFAFKRGSVQAMADADLSVLIDVFNLNIAVKHDLEVFLSLYSVDKQAFIRSGVVQRAAGLM